MVIAISRELSILLVLPCSSLWVSETVIDCVVVGGVDGEDGSGLSD